MVCSFFERIIAFDTDDGMKKKWKAFTKKINTKTDDYRNILCGIESFLKQPYLSAIQNKDFSMQWTADKQQWK